MFTFKSLTSIAAIMAALTTAAPVEDTATALALTPEIAAAIAKRCYPRLRAPRMEGTLLEPFCGQQQLREEPTATRTTPSSRTGPASSTTASALSTASFGLLLTTGWTSRSEPTSSELDMGLEAISPAPRPELPPNQFGTGGWSETPSTMRILAAHSTVLGLYMPRDTTLNSPEVVMAQNCKDIATKLLEELEKLRAAEEGGKGRIWRSVTAALQEAWTESDLEELLKKLKVYQDNLQFYVLISVRESIEFLSQRQNDQFLESNAVMEKLVEVLESHQNVISRDDSNVETFRSLKLGESTEFDLKLLAPPEVIRKSALSYAEALLREEAAILNSLKFPVMLDREEDISTAEKKTFDWIFEDPKPDELPWSNFRAWLREDDPLYWITGKAGSGKSTLTKYIFCHPRTTREISLWATSAQPLIIAGFFFWNTGSAMQKTQQGLFREIGFNKPDDLSDIWTNSRLERSFSQAATRTLRLSLKDLSSAESVRICASSRPYIAFQNAFGKFPSLMLQNLTYRDIKTYVTTKFSENAQMTEVQRREPETVRLAKEVVEKAAGVFLWVKLVVRSLLEGLGSFDSLSDLRRRLEDLPDDLEDLYWHIL
ncbi:hypothetical protein V8F33_013828 [Rhypophila sp. PSN 637]